MKTAYLYCDGGARGNPGPAGAAAVFFDIHHHPLGEIKEFLGRTTNNVAEYQGILLGLKLARSHGIQVLKVRLDSELIVEQIKGHYRVRHPGLRPLWEEVRMLLKTFSQWEVVHIPRSENSAADRLVNLAIDQGVGRTVR